jgi:hypothetical protein
MPSYCNRVLRQQPSNGFGLERLGIGVAATLLGGDSGQICTNVVQNRSSFGTRRPKAIEPPGPTQQQHNNQTMNKKERTQVAREGLYGWLLDPDLPFCTMLLP